MSLVIKGGGGGGLQGQKSCKHDFEIIGDPKVSPSGSTFWWGSETLFRTKKSKMANKAQNQDLLKQIDR